ncbi:MULTISPECIES: fused uroporphyrinogen-III synthase HemD/membrane protein HemX [unclassified Caballeronia]|uniref:fused uroporphyrinogen-III synthase HemD/membrane protein HemX n=1 Tax=unclassified Caballeronia TaxID=2646786 RepID=UPI002856AA24|nr:MULTISPECIES: fused uroporphyrinogen-III synthase HemD/membrane protein HemX [unclassified Caballeronia]MDR5736402.1 fused uroporphyrinogen-III synthase HemD/membrane protein HemX [Caballeronia sp. LZ016]MDR5811121.1 fused uroporphyrinogen-III synthase HemD/membrane protein HemX [Caballeronia sp. LZ019]
MASAHRATVVITRPGGQSSALVERLHRAHLDAFEFPLIDIAAVSDDAPLRAALDELYGPGRYALVVFVSPNAIDHAFGRLFAPWPVDIPVAAVGPGSVAALARQGVSAPGHRVISPSAEHADPRFDSEALYTAIEAHFGANGLEGKRVLIVRGDGGREWLADRLAEAGARVEKAAAYRRLLPEPSMQEWERIHSLLAGEPHAWLLTSSEGVRNLDELAREHLTADEIARLKRAPVVCPHPRIAEAARQTGFDRITVSGAGDERIVDTLQSLLPDNAAAPAQSRGAAVSTDNAPAHSPDNSPAHQPAQSRMTDSNDSKKASPQPNVTPPLPPNTPFTLDEQQKRRGGAGIVLLWFVVAILAIAAGAGGYALNRKVDRKEQQLTQRVAQSDAQNADLRAKADQAASATGALNTQIIQLQGKLADAEAHSQALQQQYQDLASNRDDWTLAEVEQILSSASQQLQLTGNVQLALFALESADTRLAATTGPQVVSIRKAIAQDMDKLKAAPTTDLTGLAIKLDTAIEQIDALPLAGEAPIERARAQAAAPGDSASIAAATGEPRWKVLWRQVTTGIGQQLASLVSVRRIDNADAMLTSPDQGYFVRENVKLRLLSARLSLLSRSEATLKSDLQAADASLGRYFDPSSKKVQAVRGLVKQVDQASLAVAVPNLNASLAAVHQFKRGG